MTTDIEERRAIVAFPPRAFYSLYEAAARWGCTLSDIAGWASVGRFDIATGIAPTRCSEAVLEGIVAVPVQDILPMFLLNGAGPAKQTLRRIRMLNSRDWLLITDTDHKVKVTLDTLVIMADAVLRFERECDVQRRPAVSVSSTKKYDWDGMYISLIKRVHEQGVPESQNAWIGEVQEWFVRNSVTGEVPDERTIRRRITPVWKSLRDTCG